MDTDIPLYFKAMGVVITNVKADGSLTYDAVRRAWKLSEAQLKKAEEASYILAIENGTVVDVFEKHGPFRESADEPGRYTFSPVPVCNANIRREYIGCRYRSYGQAVIFFGYSEAE